MGTREHPPTPSQTEEDGRTTRRNFLGLAVKSLGAAAVGGSVLALEAKSVIDREARERSQELTNVYEFLRGNTDQTMNIFGAERDYNEVCDLLRELCNPPITQKELEALLDSFISMMEIEDKFAGSLNVIPLLEDLEFAREKYFQDGLHAVGVKKDTLLLSNTFGYGQIHPDTARMIVLDKQEKFLQLNVLTKEALQQLGRDDLAYYETSDLLDLRGGGNLIISFLAFFEGCNLYARSTGGAVHGGLSFPDNRGALQPMRHQNPRGFTLAISAYSAGLEAPMVAKAQTYMNEMLLTDDANQPQSVEMLLDIDGDIGDRTLDAMRKTAERYHFPFPEDLALHPKNMDEQRRQLVALDQWLEHARKNWRASVEGLSKNEQQPNPLTLSNLVRYRYSFQVRHYQLLKKHAGEEQAKKLFLEFVDRREEEFLHVIVDPDAYERLTGRRDHQAYLQELFATFADRMAFDERYKGYIPTNFKLASQPGADPMNMPARLLLAFEFDMEASSRIK